MQPEIVFALRVAALGRDPLLVWLRFPVLQGVALGDALLERAVGR